MQRKKRWSCSGEKGVRLCSNVDIINSENQTTLDANYGLKRHDLFLRAEPQLEGTKILAEFNSLFMEENKLSLVYMRKCSCPYQTRLL